MRIHGSTTVMAAKHNAPTHTPHPRANLQLALWCEHELQCRIDHSGGAGRSQCGHQAWLVGSVASLWRWGRGRGCWLQPVRPPDAAGRFGKGGCLYTVSPLQLHPPITTV